MSALKVLTVDDSRTMLDMLRATLEEAGFEVSQAENGQEGLERVAEDTFDCIITDINMPVMDGFEFTRRMRGGAGPASVPILILTTETSREKRDLGREAGATGWITKPFDGEAVVGVIRRVCG